MMCAFIGHCQRAEQCGSPPQGSHLAGSDLHIVFKHVSSVYHIFLSLNRKYSSVFQKFLCVHLLMGNIPLSHTFL